MQEGVYVSFLISAIIFVYPKKSISSSFKWLKKKLGRGEGSKSETADVKNRKDKAEIVIPPSEDNELDEKFKLTCEKVKSANLFSLLTQQQQLILYGLFKQAVEGDCNQPKPKGIIDLKKWEAWKDRYGISRKEAKQLYVKNVEDFAPNLKIAGPSFKGDADDIDDGVFMTEEEFQESRKKRKDENKLGFGMTFSKPESKTTNDNDDKENEDLSKFFNCVLEENILEMEELIKQGFDLNSENLAGIKAIHYAVDNEKVQSVEFLVGKYDNVDIEDQVGNTALWYAVTVENEEIIELLLERGADLDHKNAEGETPYACASKKLKEKFNKLKKKD